MNNKFFLSLIATFMMVLGINAQNNTYHLVIEMNNGTKINIGPNDINNMSFTDGELIVSGENINDIKKEIATLKEKVSEQKNCECSTEIDALKKVITSLKSDFAAINITELITIINVLQMQIKSLADEVSALKNNGDNQGGSDNQGVSTIVGEAIDLGLSVKWASCNIDATKPEEYGGFYAWGEVSQKETYNADTYVYAETETVYKELGNSICGTQYDVAHMKWGGSWRMPTIDEFKELVNKCTWVSTTINGTKGTQVTGPNGNSIFFPAGGRKYGSNGRHRDEGEVGCYWSGTLYNGVYAMDLLIFGSTTDLNDSRNRANGMLIRPVSE